MEKNPQVSGIADTFKLPESKISIDNIVANIIETEKDTAKILPKENGININLSLVCFLVNN